MLIAALRRPGLFELEDAHVPSPRPDEVLVKVSACGVCASELDVWSGIAPADYPLYLGHEVSGTVVKRGDEVNTVSVGDGVGVWVTTRGFAEYVVVKAAYCRPAGDVALDSALAEPLACAVNAVEKADVRLADDVVVIGAGFMGNLVQQLVQLRGPRSVVVADTRTDALDRATALGASRVVQVGGESLADVVVDVTDGRGADVTFECTGTQAALGSLGEVTRMSGKVVLVGFHQGRPREISLALWNWMAFEVVNAHFREVSTIMRGMTVGMRLLAAQALDVASLVTHRFALVDINEAFQTAADKPAGFVKATVLCAQIESASTG